MGWHFVKSNLMKHHILQGVGLALRTFIAEHDIQVFSGPWLGALTTRPCSSTYPFPFPFPAHALNVSCTFSD